MGQLACGPDSVGLCGAALALQLVVYGATNGAILALNAIAFSLAYAVARQINLAHGNVFALTSVVATSLAGALGVRADSPPAARLLAILLLSVAGAVCGGALNGAVERLAFRPFRRPAGPGDPLGPLIASVGLAFVLFQAAVWWHAAYFVPQPGPHQGVGVPLLAMPDLLPALELGGWAGVSFTTRDASVLLMAGLVAGATWGFLGRTRRGRGLRAAAEDPGLAALCGVEPRRAVSLAFVLAGALAGLAATLFSLYYGVDAPDYGLRAGLAAMAAAVLGGVGSPGGALLAGLGLGVFGAFSDYFLAGRWTPVLVLLILVLTLAWRPRGLRGHAGPLEAEAPQPVAAPVGATGRATGWLLWALLALALVFPALDALGGWNRVPGATAALLLVTLSLGLALVVSYAGLLDLGYAAFFAIGSYSAALETASGSRLAALLPALVRDPWLALPTAGVVAAGFGLLFGVPSVRARGEYLAIVTLAFGELVPGVIGQLPEWTGGARGVNGIPMPQAAFLPFAAPDSALHPYLLALALAVTTYVLGARLVASRVGRALGAVRDDEVAASALGVEPTRTRLLAFSLGGACAGIAGAVFAGQFGHVEPQQFDLTLSLMALAAVVIGGRWGLPGAVLGALAVAGFDRLLLDALTGALRGLGGALDVAWLQATDLRAHGFAVFGGALYLAVLLRARRP